MKAYNDKLDPDQQIAMEEKIAARVLDAIYDEDGGDEASAKAGRAILRMVLSQFRPDLVETDNATNQSSDTN